MTIRNILSSIVLIAVITIIPIWLFINLPFVTSRDVANATTGEQIKAVKPGMTVEDVLTLLGKPYKYTAGKGIHLLTCKHPKKVIDASYTQSTDIHKELKSFFEDTAYCCKGNKDDLSQKEFSFEYTRAVRFFSYPMLWIDFDEHDRVSRVYAKKYDWTNDFTIYELSIETNNKARINEKDFRDCFK